MKFFQLLFLSTYLANNEGFFHGINFNVIWEVIENLITIGSYL